MISRPRPRSSAKAFLGPVKANDTVALRLSAAVLASRRGDRRHAEMHRARAYEVMPSLERRVGATSTAAIAEILLARSEPEAALRLLHSVMLAAAPDPPWLDELMVWGARAAADLVEAGDDAGDPDVVTRARRGVTTECRCLGSSLRKGDRHDREAEDGHHGDGERRLRRTTRASAVAGGTSSPSRSMRGDDFERCVAVDLLNEFATQLPPGGLDSERNACVAGDLPDAVGIRKGCGCGCVLPADPKL